MQYRDPVLEGAERTVDRSLDGQNSGVLRRIGNYTKESVRPYMKALGRYAAIVGLATTLALSGVPAQVTKFITQNPAQVTKSITQNPDQGIAYAQSKKSKRFGLVTINYPSDVSDERIDAVGNWIVNDMTPKVLEFLLYPRYPGRTPSWERPYTIDFDLSYSIGTVNLKERVIRIRARPNLSFSISSLIHEFTHLVPESGWHVLPEGLASWTPYIYTPQRNPHTFIQRVSNMVPLAVLSNEISSEASPVPQMGTQGPSFIKFLVEEKGGMQKFMEFFLDTAQAYHRAGFNSIPNVRWNYERFYGMSLEQLEQEWLAFLKEKYALQQ